MTRIDNNTAVDRLPSPAEAKAMLRNRYLQTEACAPALNLLEVLLAAYPEAQRPPEPDGDPGGTDWQRLAWALAIDFVPAFQPGGAPGRPVARKDGLVQTVDRIMATGEATSITHACNIVERSKLFPEITDVRKAYYRRKKLSQ